MNIEQCTVHTSLFIENQANFQGNYRILLYRGFPRPIWPAKYRERSEGYFAVQTKLYKGTLCKVKIL